MTTDMPTPDSINADFSAKAIVNSPAEPWLPSPSPGVDRRLLDRVGGEVARATSIVRYAAGSSFETHAHDHGEEFFVLEGVFSDEHGDYPAGTYVRNPPGSSHAPRSEGGCTIFVKLRQFAADDLERVVIDTTATEFSPGRVPGLTVLPLHEHQGVSTALVKWASGCHFHPHTHFGGEEILVLQGVFSDEHGDYPAGTWLRSPDMSMHTPYTEPGCLIYVKVGHLAAAA
ncbi:MAG: anti-sigma factor ChrR (cupin superfamily) [Bradymonadia bacterium]|jgi:anti-sigma factor ChrR (cupin superfamily)